MKKNIILGMLIMIFITVTGCKQDKGQGLKQLTTSDLAKEGGKESYVIGSDLAKVLDNPENKFDYDAFVQGFTDQYKKRPMLMTEEEMNVVRKEYQKNTQKLSSNPYPKLSPEGSAIASERFMMDNIKKDGVKKTESGLQYTVIKEGSGSKPSAGGKIRAHYIGTLRKGEVFENTYEKGEPVEMSLDRVVKGLAEGIQLMNEGSKYKFFIPPNLGYGSKEMGPIMPNSVVIFEVELFEVLN
ncbi:MAG: FKBP-type peptidyl-prolyl cis-trans isomerase [Candidatus Delongbacteria bacterium]|jgi:FKBP-type peptidyl-prolyl cis-trans isomerase|nr:FKBP-type peptidyl-prolyl cis-trans isomerase [Candidatus Delongbacteria bacterium]